MAFCAGVMEDVLLTEYIVGSTQRSRGPFGHGRVVVDTSVELCREPSHPGSPKRCRNKRQCAMIRELFD